MSTSQPVIHVSGIRKTYSQHVAVDDVSFEVHKGEIFGLIGPNGAGKTTTFNVIAGYYRPSAGRISYRGEAIAGLSTNQIARRGLVRTFQSTTLFQEFSAFKNVLVGCHLHAPVNFVGAILGTGRGVERGAESKALEILEFMGLAERKDELASDLPHGLQRALGMAVALVAGPKLLLLDEPFTGMNPEETGHMMELVRRVRDKGVTLLLVEHDMQAVMGLCDKITVLNFGQLLTEGTPEEIRHHPDVVEAYLGAVSGAA